MKYNTFENLENLKIQELIPGFFGKLIHTDKMSISFFEIKAGSKLPEHKHFHEQTSIVQEGDFEFTIDGNTKVVGPGDYIRIAPNTPHSAIAITDCKIIDVFVPAREDYKIK